MTLLDEICSFVDVITHTPKLTNKMSYGLMTPYKSTQGHHKMKPVNKRRRHHRPKELIQFPETAPSIGQPIVIKSPIMSVYDGGAGNVVDWTHPSDDEGGDSDTNIYDQDENDNNLVNETTISIKIRKINPQPPPTIMNTRKRQKGAPSSFSAHHQSPYFQYGRPNVPYTSSLSDPNDGDDDENILSKFRFVKPPPRPAKRRPKLMGPAYGSADAGRFLPLPAASQFYPSQNWNQNSELKRPLQIPLPGVEGELVISSQQLRVPRNGGKFYYQSGEDEDEDEEPVAAGSAHHLKKSSKKKYNKKKSSSSGGGSKGAKKKKSSHGKKFEKGTSLHHMKSSKDKKKGAFEGKKKEGHEYDRTKEGYESHSHKEGKHKKEGHKSKKAGYGKKAVKKKNSKKKAYKDKYKMDKEHKLHEFWHDHHEHGEFVKFGKKKKHKKDDADKDNKVKYKKNSQSSNKHKKVTKKSKKKHKKKKKKWNTKN